MKKLHKLSKRKVKENEQVSPFFLAQQVLINVNVTVS